MRHFSPLHQRSEEVELDATQARSLVDLLVNSGARFHGWAPDVEVSWGLNLPALESLTRLVDKGARTLETGVGLSTVVFAAAGAEHTVVSPASFEHDRVKEWCIDNSIDVSGVTFIAAGSQDALPTLDPTPLDIVLIDGDHAFPAPYIDFWYAARRLVPGGMLIVDDTHLRACRVLCEFLLAEHGRWKVREELETTSIFERLDGPMVPPEGWMGQPWGAEPDQGGAGIVARLRSRVRLRTRLRSLLGGTTHR